jgi:hypothetical protein
MLRVRKPGRGAWILLLASALPAQLQSGDVVLLTSSGITHLAAATGAATPVAPVPGDGNPVPTSWLDGACEWLRNTQYVLVGQDAAPYGLYLLDFTPGVAAPVSWRLGLGIGGIRDIDQIEATGDVLVLQNVVQQSGRIDVLTAPVTPSSVLGANPPWATMLLPNQADYLAVQSPTSVVVGGVANIYQVQQGSSNGGALLSFGGTLPYSIESVDIDQATGDMYLAQFNPDLVNRYAGGVGLSYSFLATVLGPSEIDGPEDVEFDPNTQTIWGVGRNGGWLFGVPWGVQTGFDNTVVGNFLLASPGSGYTAAGPIGGHGNSGLFANIAVIGNIVQNPAMLITTGTGCIGSSGLPFTFAANGLPYINNSAFALSLSGGPPFQPFYIFLALATSPAPIPITPLCNLYLDPVTLSALITAGQSPIGPLPLDLTGGIQFGVPIPFNPMLIGTSLSAQVAATDAVPGGLVSSNALTLVFGN